MFDVVSEFYTQRQQRMDDFIPPQEAGAPEVLHRDSSLKLMERDGGCSAQREERKAASTKGETDQGRRRIKEESLHTVL